VYADRRHVVVAFGVCTIDRDGKIALTDTEDGKVKASADSVVAIEAEPESAHVLLLASNPSSHGFYQGA
jgi:redox-sensitive bicupin YhaK (pirin superfamily)